MNNRLPVVPYNGWATNPWIHAAAAAGGAMARAGFNRVFGPQPRQRVVRYMPPPPPAPVINVQTAPRRGRGRGRGRGRPRNQSTRNTNIPRPGPSGSKVIITDTEVLGTPLAKLAAFEFNPAPAGLTRLANLAKMYERYRFHYINISYKATSPTTQQGQLAMGVMPGQKSDKVKSNDEIVKLRPMVICPPWKSDSMSLGRNIDSQRYMHVGRAGDDGVSFTLYVNASAANMGVIQISYRIEFEYPSPF